MAARLVLFGMLACLMLSLGAVRGSVAAEPVRFDTQIRPILSSNCFSCHGPDEQHREADLRLDMEEGLFDDRGGYHAVVPGKADESELFRRLVSQEDWERMPPPDSGHELTVDQIALIRRWIDEGAQWRQHWAFVTPERAPLPEVRDRSWVRTPVDRFVLARLEAEGLSSSPEADRRTLVRRVTFDLTGLPPRLEDVHAFLADTSPDAYEKLVDRLLADESFGEHMARFWLDVARYGDTHGLHLDNYREMWPYRDWVIRAFNRNLPYDQFIVEQLAGDLLPEATLEQQVASGFNRTHVTTNEGGSIEEEVYVRNVIERVDGFGTAMLGLTLTCASCHDHKYDPVSQKDFYSLFAFFNSLDGPEMDGNVKDSAPSIRVPTDQQAAQLAGLRGELAQRRADRAARLDAAESETAPPGFDPWLADLAAAAGSARAGETFQTADGLVVHCRLDEASGEEVFDERGDDKPGRVVGTPRWVEGRVGGAIEIAEDSHVDLGDRGKFKEDQPFSYGAWVQVPDGAEGAILARAVTNEGMRGYEVYALADGRVAAMLSGRWPGYAIKITTSQPVLQPDAWHHVLVTYDGSKLVDGLGLHVDGEPQPVVVNSDSLKHKSSISTNRPLLIGRRDSEAPLVGARIDDVRLYDRRLTEAEVMAVYLGSQLEPLAERPTDEWSPHEQQLARTFYAVQHDPGYAELTDEVERLRSEIIELELQLATTLVFRERQEPKPAYLLIRGEYDQHGEQVARETPPFLPPMNDDLPRDRLGLAQWLLMDEHPLTSRVAVNRFWQQLFGTGLVKTSEDLGNQGSPPSHPELLDWLAVEFRDSGWDVKRLMKRIVMSATYRQASQATPAMVDRDPENRLLARGPRFRLDAEMLRDQALAVSDLLYARIGGPSVKPPQPADLWYAVGYSGSNTVHFEADEGLDKVFRRSLYTFWKRTSPPPQLSAFDAPSREACVVRRERTNTPLQALVLMNEPQYVEAARHFAQRALREGPASAWERAVWLFERATMRTPEDAETRELLDALDVFQAEYAADVEAARKLIALGELPPDESLDPAELASWTMVANLLLNLDEVITKE